MLRPFLSPLAFAAFACASLSSPRVAIADPDHGFSFGIRTGFAWPVGRIQGQSDALTAPTFGTGTTNAPQDVEFGDKYVGMLPIWVDAGYRFLENFYVGVYFQYGLAFPAGASGTNSLGCPSGATCSGADYRVGVQAHWHVLPKRVFDPWFGLGFGYEVATLSGTQGDNVLSQSLTGVELFDLQAGIDAKATPGLRVGPFVSLSFAQFTGFSSNDNGVQTTGSVTPTAPHLWLMVGARAQYDL